MEFAVRGPSDVGAAVSGAKWANAGDTAASKTSVRSKLVLGARNLKAILRPFCEGKIDSFPIECTTSSPQGTRLNMGALEDMKKFLNLCLLFLSGIAYNRPNMKQR